MTAEFRNYDEAQRHQLQEWLAGRPWHNPWAPGAAQAFPDDRAKGECCPDFSCCRPDMIWAEDRRIAFVTATDEAREGMLFGALCGLTRTTDDQVYIAGQTEFPND